MPAQKVEIIVRSPRREPSPLQHVTPLLISWCKCLQELPPGRLETSITVKYERPKSGRTISVDSDGLGRARVFLDCALCRCGLYALQHSLLELFPGSSFPALRLLSPAFRRSYHGPSITASHKDILASTPHMLKRWQQELCKNSGKKLERAINLITSRLPPSVCSDSSVCSGWKATILLCKIAIFY